MTSIMSNYAKRNPKVNWQIGKNQNIILFYSYKEKNLLCRLDKIASLIWLMCDGNTKTSTILQEVSSKLLPIYANKKKLITDFILDLKKRDIIIFVKEKKPDYNYNIPDIKKTFAPKIKIIYSQNKENSSQWYAMLYSYLNKVSHYNQFYRPQKVNFDLTYGCNLKCTHCYLNDNNFQEKYSIGDVNIEKIKKIIDKISESGIEILNLFGGEPTSRKDFMEILEYGIKKDMGIIVNTNMTLLTKNRLIQIKNISPNVLFNVSLDGCYAETHDAIRGKNTFKLAMKNTKQAISMGFPVQVNFAAVRTNAFQVPKLHRLLSKMKVNDLTILLFNEIGRGSKNIDKHRMHGLQYLFLVVYESLYPILKQFGFSTNIKILPCTAYSFTHIDQYGNLHFCTMMPREYIIDNIFQRSLMDIWHSKKYRKMHNFVKYLPEPCKSCFFMKTQKCIGGCRAQTYEKTNNFFAATPYCTRKQIFYDLSSVFLGKRMSLRLLKHLTKDYGLEEYDI